jgi:hypothetical protein
MKNVVQAILWTSIVAIFLAAGFGLWLYRFNECRQTFSLLYCITAR